MPSLHRFDEETFAALIERESDLVELKTGVGKMPMQEVLVAMSNTSGGRIFIGVDDQRRVVGRALDQGTDDAIHEAALAARSVGRYRVESGAVGARAIVVVTVESRAEDVAQTSDGRVLVRRGGRSVALFGQDLWTLMAARTLQRFESTSSRLSTGVVDRSRAQEVADRFGWDDEEAWVDRWAERGLVHPDGDLTVAGALVLTDPVDALGAAKWIVDLRSYEDETTTSYVRREQFGGPVFEQVRRATEWVLRDIGTEMVLTGTTRHDVPRLPPRAVREAVANAVAHRDYSADRSSVVIEVRPSRVVVRSPGGLPVPVTVATLRSAQAARNPSVIDVLRRFGLAEDGGQGIDVIEDQLRYELLGDPSFQEAENGFEVSLPLRGLVSNTERGWLAEFERRGVLKSVERPLLLAVVREGRVTNGRAREVMGVDSTQARVALQRLARSNLLQQHGERGRAYYTLGVIGPDRNPEDVLLEAASREPLSNSRVRAITGLDSEGALALLRRLVRAGKLEQTGSKRGTRYRAVAPKRRAGEESGGS